MTLVSGTASDQPGSSWIEEHGLPAALKTIERLDHGVSSSKIGISLESPSNRAKRLVRDSSDHCSTN